VTTSWTPMRVGLRPGIRCITPLVHGKAQIEGADLHRSFDYTRRWQSDNAVM
jgi:hypothetical protein